MPICNLQSAISNCFGVYASMQTCTLKTAIPPIDLLLKNNCTIVLGTDSLASNWNLNLLDEMKSIQKHFPDISMQQLLQCATVNGAQALQMENVLGSFEKGKQPGVVIIDNLTNGNIIPLSTCTRLV